MNIDKELKKHFIARLAAEGRRVDGRKLDEAREISITTNVISDKAEGSAWVKLGGTEVLCGIKVILATPYSDRPDSGVMMTGAELCPIASPEFEAGRPGENAIELARVIDRGIRESNMIELDKLCIVPGEKVWMVSIDIHIINDEGNLLDAGSIAAVAALKSAWIPTYNKKTEEVKLEKSMDMPLTKLPISCTFVKIGETIMIDPCTDEEYATDARLTVTTSGKAIHAMQKGGIGAFSSKEVIELINLAMKKHKDLEKLVKK